MRSFLMFLATVSLCTVSNAGVLTLGPNDYKLKTYNVFNAVAMTSIVPNSLPSGCSSHGIVLYPNSNLQANNQSAMTQQEFGQASGVLDFYKEMASTARLAKVHNKTITIDYFTNSSLGECSADSLIIE